jgi:hypothetical protein
MEFPNEGFVQRAIETFFEGQGYCRKVAKDTDLVCERAGERWAIEAKGVTASVGLDFRTGLGQLVQRMDDAGTKYREHGGTRETAHHTRFRGGILSRRSALTGWSPMFARDENGSPFDALREHDSENFRTSENIQIVLSPESQVAQPIAGDGQDGTREWRPIRYPASEDVEGEGPAQ